MPPSNSPISTPRYPRLFSPTSPSSTLRASATSPRPTSQFSSEAPKSSSAEGYVSPTVLNGQRRSHSFKMAALFLAEREFPTLPRVEAFGIRGPVTLHPEVFRPVTHLERLWAYLTVRQLLDARETAESKQRLEAEALALALKYSFVTSVSSLVVVKPDEPNRAVEAVRADGASGGGVLTVGRPSRCKLREFVGGFEGNAEMLQ